MGSGRDVDCLICVATGREGALIRGMLGGGPPARGSIAGHSVVLLETGVGPVNAACAATRFLAQRPAAALIVCGVGGAYPGSGLETGDVLCAQEEVYGDLGADSETGFVDMQQLGFPVVAADPPLYNRMPLDLYPCERRGVFVTRSTCTGSDAAAAALRERTGGDVESMEGAALVHTALLHGLPVGQLRGISNPVGNRDRGAWKVTEAARAAQEALLAWLETSAATTR